MIPHNTLTAEKPTILFCWELGMGLGHIGTIAPVAHATMSAGFHVVVASKDVGPDVKKHFEGIDLIESVTLPESPYDSRSYAEILLNTGFENKDDLLGAVKAWEAIFAAKGVDVVAADHAPLAVLAAKACNIPTIIFGAPINVPPPASLQPALRPWAPIDDHDERLSSEKLAVENINHVLSAYGRGTIDSVYQMYSAQEIAITGVSSLDFFQRDQSVQPISYVGDIQLAHSETQSIAWPTGNGPRIFVYMRKNIPCYPVVMQALLSKNCRVFAVVPDLEDLNHENLVITTKPADLDKVASEADLCISYGSFSTSAAMLRHGVPVIACPNTAERGLSAWQLKNQGAGLMIAPGATVQDVLEAVEKVLSTPSFYQAASVIQEEIRISDQEAAVGKIVELIRRHGIR